MTGADQEKRDEQISDFMNRLARLLPADRARLKRNAGRRLSEAHDVLGLFFRLLPPKVPAWQHEMYFLVATLYPLARNEGSGDFGAALRRARSDANPKGIDRRVEALLDADRGQLPFRLRQAIGFLHGHRLPVSWPTLLHDILNWDDPYRRVQLRWAASYFGHLPPAD